MKFDSVFPNVSYEVIRIEFSADTIKFNLTPTIWCQGYEYHSDKKLYISGHMYYAVVAQLDRDWKTMGYMPPDQWKEPYRSRFLGVSGPESAKTAGIRLRLRRLSTG